MTLAYTIFAPIFVSNICQGRVPFFDCLQWLKLWPGLECIGRYARDLTAFASNELPWPSWPLLTAIRCLHPGCSVSAVCSNDQPLQQHQLFLMSLICNVHPDSTLLDITPSIPAPQQQQQQPGQNRQQQQQQRREGLGFGGTDMMYQYPVRPDGGPVVPGIEAPGGTKTRLFKAIAQAMLNELVSCMPCTSYKVYSSVLTSSRATYCRVP